MKGYTLIEIVIATALLSITGIAVISTFGTIMKAYGRGQDLLKLTQNGVILLNRLEIDVSNAVFFDNPRLEGDSSKVTFSTLITTLTGDSPVQVPAYVTYAQDENDRQVVKRIITLPGSPASDTLKVSRDVKTFELSYLFIDDNDQAEWTNTWNNSGDFPLAVKVALLVGAAAEPEAPGHELHRTLYFPLGLIKHENP